MDMTRFDQFVVCSRAHVVAVGPESADFSATADFTVLTRALLLSEVHWAEVHRGQSFSSPKGVRVGLAPVRAVLEGAITGKENGERGKATVQGTREGRSAAWARVQDALQPHTGGSVLPQLRVPIDVLAAMPTVSRGGEERKGRTNRNHSRVVDRSSVARLERSE